MLCDATFATRRATCNPSAPAAAAGLPLDAPPRRITHPHLRTGCLAVTRDGGRVAGRAGGGGECRTAEREGRFQGFPPPPDGTSARRDSLFDLAMIASFRVAMASVAGWQAPEEWGPGRPGESYKGLVKVARKLFATSPAQTTERIRGVLRVFPTKPQLLRNNKLSFELLGALTPLLFPFLVGPCKTETWTSPDSQQIRSKVVIERCRFLEESGCKGMCVGLCQQPTVQFFNQDLGLRMNMVPNFETGGCELTWGMEPSTGIEASQDSRCYTGCGLQDSAALPGGRGTAGSAAGLATDGMGTCHLLRQWIAGEDYVAF
mmetsp:Transcript_24129/g.61860  ORF Transcript_24129/g.61860 Transcript_24129/m.61860 type:complete len:318 (+) Transcript_24129:95-1048(+)|eukprot:jgi/Tetstr1/423275/TSEL_013974.t1